MGYVGNEPSVNFTSFAKQDITGDGGASYTLTHAVANANEIEVFVNNVRQEPTEAYTVSGTALTMTGNVASTDDFYVIYLGKALQTTVTPDGSVTTAKIVDDAVTSAKISDGTIVNGDINASAGIDGSKLGTNAIKNVVTSLSRISDSTSNTTYTDTGMSASITPSSTSSKILIMVHLVVQLAGSRSRYTIHSSATNGTLHGASDEGFVALEGNTNANRNVAFHHVDSPNTTSSVTYKVQHLNTGGSSTFLVNDNPQEITLLEIGG